MNPDATTFLTLDQVAGRIDVAKSTVEEWVSTKQIESFKKGKVRRVSEEALTKFVLLNTVKPRRPDWLTAEIQTEFERRLETIVDRRFQELAPMRLLAV